MKHIHILGICGTFMAGIAAIAKQLGYRVSGCDANVYPPMSTQLAQLDIEVQQGYLIEHLAYGEQNEPDVVIIGNALSRGNAMVEFILERGINYTSGPQWLLDNVLKDRWVLAVSGTHGKTTTSSMLAWILEYAKLSPGFLIGGVPQNFNQSARLGKTPFFVIEADEYDTAFFDKRSKFVHYRPRTLVINNLEFDHADIFNNIADIQRQFHHLVRMVPSNGLIIYPQNEHAIVDTLAQGCWTPTEISVNNSQQYQGWYGEKLKADGRQFNVYFKGELQGRVNWELLGDFNIDNALMAIAAARHAGVPSSISIEALAEFINTKRRLELRGEIAKIRVYDDFAHHPTAIAKTLSGLRNHVDDESIYAKPQRIIAVLEPRSNTMKSGVHKDTLAASLAKADYVFIYQSDQVKWPVSTLVSQCKQACWVIDNIDYLVEQVSNLAQPNDHILVMSNGSFSGFHDNLLKVLAKKYQTNT
jgi:UDP-N-acetylmuramate: L-alanyl-gamma-D-glutamyl-meso-diaminopimelate ligase